MLTGTFLVAVLSIFALAWARESPNADYVRELLKTKEFSRFSDNVFEDALLDVPGLISKYGYPIEVHHAVTPDGYILELHRIPHGRDANNEPSNDKPVALLLHGMMSSAADYVILGPGSALGYLLAEAGYDVWLGNARGTYYSRRHVFLDPDTPRENKYWRFSWDEIGSIDVPTMIDYALAVSGKSQLHYIGHSQGTTSFFVMGSRLPEYNKKIISMQALAPVAYLANNQNPFLIWISPHSTRIDQLASVIGIGEFLPKTNTSAWAGITFCSDESVFQPLCTRVMFLFGGTNEAQHNATMMPAILGHVPAGIAVRQLAHYGQSIAGKEFRRYDYGNALSNLRAYGAIRPPRYNLSRITSRVYLHYSDVDVFTNIIDVERLYKELVNPIRLRVPDPLFSHIDFIWASQAKEFLYDTVIASMKESDELVSEP